MQSLSAHVAVDNSGGSRIEKTPHADSRRNKRFQACIACRESKIRCLPSDRPNTCQACFKASRPCVMPGPAQPRVKSSQKFSELEKKIAVLTDALAGRNHKLQQHALESTNARPNIAGLQTPAASSSEPSPNNHDRIQVVQSVENPSSHTSAPSTWHTGLDVVDDGTIGRETATNLFRHWRENIHRFMPIVHFEPDIDIDSVRKTSPMLFLAIVTISSASVLPSMATTLGTRLSHELGQQIFVLNTQSVDIVLAALLFSQYYFQSEAPTQFVPTQYIYAALAMSADLNLQTTAKVVLKDRSSSAMLAARICVVEWFISSTTATLLHRDPIVRSSPELEKYMNILQQEYKFPESWFLSLVKMQQIIEGTGLLLDRVTFTSETAFDEPSTQYKISVLEQQLEAWAAGLPEEIDVRIKQQAVYTAHLFINKIAIRCYFRKTAVQKKLGNKSGTNYDSGMMGLTPAHFNCLTKCLEWVKGSIDLYLSFETPLARCLPNTYLRWNVTAAVIMLKLGHFGEVVSRAQGSRPTYAETVIYYLDALVAKFEHVSSEGYWPQAKPYIKILRKFKPWYLQKRDICINSRGDAVTVDEGEPTGQDSNDTVLSVPNCVGPANIPVRERTQEHVTNLSHNGWTPVTSRSAQDMAQVMPYSTSITDQLASPDVNMDAAYDPAAYASTDWNALGLDDDAMQQLDAFMLSEEETGWMHSLTL